MQEGFEHFQSNRSASLKKRTAHLKMEVATNMVITFYKTIFLFCFSSYRGGVHLKLISVYLGRCIGMQGWV